MMLAKKPLLPRPPTLWQRMRQLFGRALRETGQALDRAALKTESLATTKRTIGDDPVVYEDFLSRHRQQFPLLKRGKPVVSPNVAFVAPCATLIGSVYVGSGSSIFYKSILRADSCVNAGVFDVKEEELQDSKLEDWIWKLNDNNNTNNTSTQAGGGIFIGQNTNLQDGCIVDATHNHTVIGDGVTVGHLASIHSATIGNHCLIGMGSLINKNVTIGDECLVAAGAVVPEHTAIGEGELWVGHPARKLRDLTAEERQRLHYQASEYVQVASSQASVMQLGGNVELPESLELYLQPGHEEHDNEQQQDANVDFHGDDDNNSKQEGAEGDSKVDASRAV